MSLLRHHRFSQGQYRHFNLSHGSEAIALCVICIVSVLIRQVGQCRQRALKIFSSTLWVRCWQNNAPALPDGFADDRPRIPPLPGLAILRRCVCVLSFVQCDDLTGNILWAVSGAVGIGRGGGGCSRFCRMVIAHATPFVAPFSFLHRGAQKNVPVSCFSAIFPTRCFRLART